MKTATWILALTIVLALGHAAEARGIIIINTGDDIMELGPLQPDDVRDTGFTKLGYHYKRFGVFWLDVWRWGGEFCVYDGTRYAPLTDEDLEMLGGAQLPLAYHLPPGLVALLCGFLLTVAGALKRHRSALIAVTVATAGGTAALYFGHLGMSTILPACTAVAMLVMAFSSDPPEPADFSGGDARARP